MLRNLPCQAAKPDDVFEQSADVGVMHHFRSRSALVARGNRGIGNDAAHQVLQPGVSDGIRVFEKLRPELADVLLGVRQKIREVNFLGLGAAYLLKSELRLVAVNLDARLDFYEVVAPEFLRDGFELVPHTSFDCSAAVAKLKTKILLPFPRIANFFFVDEEKRGNALFSGEIGDERCLHQAPVSAGRLPNSRYFLWPFLVLVTSGVALTS